MAIQHNWWIRFFAPLAAHNGRYSPEFYTKIVLGLAFVAAILAVLHAFPKQYRKSIIAVFTFAAGLYYPLEFFWPTGKTGENFLTPNLDIVGNISQVLFGFAMGIGVISLVQLHGRSLAKMRPGWINNLAFLVCFVAMATATVMQQYWPNRHIFPNTTWDDAFRFLFIGGLSNLDAATYSIVAFYIGSAAYRAFRIRSVESSLLMGAALIVMIGSTTLGAAMTSWLPNGESPYANFRIEHITEWLMTEVNAPAQRGIIFGLEVGALAMALRLWLSLERGAYFDREIE